MTEKFVSLAAVAWSLPLAWAVHRNTGNTAEAGLWLLVILWIAWRIWKDWPESLQSSALPSRTLALGGWTLCAWIVSGLWPQDHGLLRLLFPALVAALLVILWGPRNLHRGWRALLIAALWVTDPFLFLLDRLLAGPRLESLTAWFASAGLWQIGSEVSRAGAQITTDAGSVIVKYGCTAIPLWALVFHLLVPAGIVFGLTLGRLLLLAGVSLLAGFVISVARVMIMALVVNDDARFHYWHGDEGGGWFTLAAFGVFGLLLIRLARPAVNIADEGKPRTIAPRSRLLLGAGAAVSILAVVRMCAAGVPAYPSEFTPPSRMDAWTLIATDPLPLPEEHVPGDRPAWIRRFSYIEENTFASLNVTAAVMPVWLDGDPLTPASLWRLEPTKSSPKPWQLVGLDADSGTSGHALHRGSGWLAGIHRSGTIVGDSAVWLSLSRRLPDRPSAWLDWLRGRTPLRQKTGLWIALETNRGAPLSAAQSSAILSRWRDSYLPFRQQR